MVRIGNINCIFTSKLLDGTPQYAFLLELGPIKNENWFSSKKKVAYVEFKLNYENGILGNGSNLFFENIEEDYKEYDPKKLDKHITENAEPKAEPKPKPCVTYYSMETFWGQ